jgi:hypothetical protein
MAKRKRKTKERNRQLCADFDTMTKIKKNGVAMYKTEYIATEMSKKYFLSCPTILHIVSQRNKWIDDKNTDNQTLF